MLRFIQFPAPREVTQLLQQSRVLKCVPKVFVSAAGAPEQVLIDRSSGHANLDEAAADIVRKRWRFAPATQGGRAVSARVAVPVSFTLKSR